ncbi:MAG: helix-turn-helix transcriptional regulator [Clostridia bacterium]|nr:helix-turn-helix transcriptional regulator [Clostridia bacterium]
MFDFLHGNIRQIHGRHVFCGNENNTLDWWIITQHQTDFLYYRNGEMVKGVAGELLIIPPHNIVWHGPRKEAQYGFIDDWLYFQSDLADKIISDLRIPTCVSFNIPNTKFLRPYIKRIQLEESMMEPGYKYMISSILYEMITDIARQRDMVAKSNSIQQRRFEKVRCEMLLEYDKNWTVESLAKIAGYSPSHFTTIYRQYFNISPIDDLLNHRLSIAKEELVKKRLSITEISKKCGFTSIHHFSRFFKKHVGVSPSEFYNTQE